MKILVVEDEPLLSMLLEENVAELGHEVVGAAGTVEHALALIDEVPIELALLDFSLGQQTTSVPIAVRLRDKGIPFLYLSGHRSLGEEGDIPSAPLLTKPFSLEQLDAAIRGMPVAA